MWGFACVSCVAALIEGEFWISGWWANILLAGLLAWWIVRSEEKWLEFKLVMILSSVFLFLPLTLVGIIGVTWWIGLPVGLLFDFLLAALIVWRTKRLFRLSPVYKAWRTT